MKVPFLGSIPLDAKIPEGGDSGHPIVLTDPDSEVSKVYQKVAGEVSVQMSVMETKADGEFASLRLDWKE